MNDPDAPSDRDDDTARESETPRDPVAGALLVIGDCRAWPQVRARLDEHGLSEALGPDGLLRVMAAWQAERAGALSDAELTAELRHWAEGGTYQSHLGGFNALSPETLLDEARRRGWFVQSLPGGRGVVTPPTGKPLVLPETPS
ncbi:hypothetical protein [Roseospirillum parvum]|uniref:Uncharacterized protein n=1 Tax=Roseospirillum parvum TaxID=83401 RepID=A0A1G8AV67_9PROT|nr:hypothetical protein [Roseospirillum parvum]SDH24754.1 hypothetical protein SAMN05421742_105117 [Roseospirillum parvum]